jgi:hypothetical protein
MSALNSKSCRRDYPQGGRCCQGKRPITKGTMNDPKATDGIQSQPPKMRLPMESSLCDGGTKSTSKICYRQVHLDLAGNSFPSVSRVFYSPPPSSNKSLLVPLSLKITFKYLIRCHEPRRKTSTDGCSDELCRECVPTIHCAVTDMPLPTRALPRD